MTEEDRTRYRQHVSDLGAFGHRGSATDHESRAADYLVGELRDLGLEPIREPFYGNRAWAGRHLLHVAVAAVGVGCLWVLPVASVVLGVVALASFWAEGITRGPWLSRPIVRAASQNVVTRISATTSPRLRVVVCGHYDTQRTGLIWVLAGWFAPWQWRLPVSLKPPLLPLAGIMTAQVLVGGAALAGLYPLLITLVGWALLTVYALYAVLFGQWALSPFVPGAADNASGVAAVLAIAREWQREPVTGIELVLLLTGCEETGLLGAAAWADQHRAETQAVPTVFLNIDCVGMGPTRFLGWEVPVVGNTVPYPPETLAVAEAVAAEQGLTDAGPYSVPGPTDGLALLARGISGVTVAGFWGRGHFPNYHRMSDTADAVDYESAYTGVEFAWALLRRLIRDSESHPD